MNIQEYDKVKDFTYLEYCDYLQKKYGIGICDYMTKSWNKNKRITRTSEGLVAHHKFEDHAIMLSHPEYAKNNPYEWQLAENIVYCDYLEHLLLHILICEYPAEDQNENEAVGIGGVVNFLVPELNDFYSGWEPNVAWKKNCLNKIRTEKILYLTLLRRFIDIYRNEPDFKIEQLFTSYNEQFGLWSEFQNQELYDEIGDIFYDLLKHDKL